jgi:hypothetical protein
MDRPPRLPPNTRRASRGPTARTASRDAWRVGSRSRARASFRIRASRRRSSARSRREASASVRGTCPVDARRVAWKTASRWWRCPTLRRSCVGPNCSCGGRGWWATLPRPRCARARACGVRTARFGFATSPARPSAWWPRACSVAMSAFPSLVTRRPVMEPRRSCVDALTLNAGSAQRSSRAKRTTRERT